MTCSSGANSVIETAVFGLPVGQGKAGVRGPVISRARQFLGKAFAAGLASGFGSGASTALSSAATTSGQTVTDPVTGQSEPPSANDLLRQIGLSGTGEGISKASELLAQYYIDRAEQYQPVISLNSGTIVDVLLVMLPKKRNSV